MGDVVTGKYQFSLNSWVMTFDRREILSFVPSHTDRMICALIPKPPEFDPGLLYRPFAKEAWICIFILLSAAFCFSIIPPIFMTSNQISMTSFWFLFVLLSAYYGGALTMFFIAESTIPFLTIRDVLKVFPEWKLVFHEPSKTVAIVEPAKSVSI